MRRDFFTGFQVKAKGAAAGFLLLLAALAVIGYWMLFSHFALYDDEGYILVAAREYFIHGKLYEVVFSQYGPAFHVLMDWIQHAMASPIDHTSARFLTLGFWLGTAVCCAALVWDRTASRTLVLFTLTATFLYLYFITDEPFHPGSSILFILALSLYFLDRLIGAERWAGAATLAGCTGAVLVLTKINVGAFYLVGVVAWGAVNAASENVRRVARPVVVAVCIGFATALMHTLLHETWVQTYVAVFAVGAVTVGLTLRGRAALELRHAAIFSVAAGSLAAVILALVWLRGTSLAGLFEGALLGPLRHPSNYSYPVDWRPGTLLVAALSLILALIHLWMRRKFSDTAADRLIVTLRLLQMAALLAALALLMNLRVVGAVFSYIAPLIWIWVVPLKGAAPTQTPSTCRGLLAIILLLQYLHAYPVGGSQESWGTFLFFPLVALGLGEVKAWLAASAKAGSSARHGWKALTAAISIVLLSKVGWTALTAHEAYSGRRALRLPGASGLRLPESERTAIRILALNAVVHADMLFSLPGMYSFNLWTELPTPTPKNTTLWFTLLNDDDQRAIQQALERSARPCIIVQESLLKLMEVGKIPARGILRDYLDQNFTPVFRTEGYAFLVRAGRPVSPLGVAQLTQRSTPDRSQPDTQLDFCLLSDGAPITALEVNDLFSTSSSPLTLDATNTQASLIPIDRAGNAMGSATPVIWPLQFKGISRLSVQFNRRDTPLSAVATVVYVKGATGEILGEVRIAE